MCSAYWGVMRGDNTYSMYMQHLRYEVGSADRDNILQFLIPALCVCIQCSSHWLCNGFCWNELCCTMTD